MKYAILLIMAVLLSTVVSANEICEYIIEEKDVTIGKTLPSFLPYKNEVFIAYQNENVIGHVQLKDGVITSINCNNTNETATYTVTVKDLQTVKDVFESNNTADIFNEKQSNDDIIVKGETFTKSVKLFFTNVGIKIASWFT